MSIYVLHVITGREYSVADDVSALGCWTLVPECERRRRKGGEWTYYTEILMPGYVFFGADELTPQLYYSVMKATGVIRLLSDEPLPEWDVEFLNRLSDTIEIQYVVIESGDVATISGGQLDGEELSGYNRRARRGSIKKRIAGRSVSITVSTHDPVII